MPQSVPQEFSMSQARLLSSQPMMVTTWFVVSGLSISLKTPA